MGTNLATLGIKAIEETEGYRLLRSVLSAQGRLYPPDMLAESVLDTTSETGPNRSVVPARDDPWLPRADSAQTKNLILSGNIPTQRAVGSLPPRRFEWPLTHAHPEPTDLELGPAFNKLDDETAGFVAESGLTASVAWLQVVAPHVFDGADFDIELLPAEDSEERLLALKVYGAFSPSEFRKRRHRICDAMLAADHKGLYAVISIFQRRVVDGGWQTLSRYSSLSAE